MQNCQFRHGFEFGTHVIAQLFRELVWGLVYNIQYTILFELGVGKGVNRDGLMMENYKWSRFIQDPNHMVGLERRN